MAGHRTMSWVVRILVAGLMPSWFAACGSSNDGGAGSSTVDNGGPSGPSTPTPAPATNPNMGGAVTDGEGAGGVVTSPTDEGVAPTTGTGNEGVMPTGLDEGAGMQPEASGNEMTGEEGTPIPTVVCPAGATLQAGDTTRTIMMDGVQRSFLVHAPPSYDGTTPVPVVLDFHGLGGNSNQQRNLTRWDDVADAQGFISVYPQGIENAWNAGGCCGNTGSDDIAFVRAIIQTLSEDACIDTRRVFASGCSNGGGMSYRLACEAADVIAAVAPVDFDCVLGQGCGDCAPSRPITVVQFRGTADQLVDYEGQGAFVGAQANLATWGEINECTDSAAALEQNDSCEGFAACGDSAQTILCTVEGGTHCGSYGSFMIAEVAWGVLSNQTLP
jgi:polyhydroxybutyrate depolymerase